MKFRKSWAAGVLALASTVFIAGCERRYITQSVSQIQIVNLGSTPIDKDQNLNLNSDASCSTDSHATDLVVDRDGKWSTSNSSVAIVSASADGRRAHIAAAAGGNGDADITFTAEDGSKMVIHVHVSATPCRVPTGTASLIFTPPGGNLTVNVPTTLTVTCKDASGNNATCTGASASSSNPLVISASGLTITCLAAGQSATVTVTANVNGTAVSNQGTFNCVSGSTPTISLNQTGPVTLHTGQNCLATDYTKTISTVGGVLANWDILNTALLVFQTPRSGQSQVTVAGVLGQSGQTTLTATGVNGGSASITFILDNTACASQNQTLTVTPNPINLTFCGAGFTGTSQPVPIVLRADGNVVPPDQVVYEQAGQLLSINPVSGMATPANVGSSYVRISTKSNPTNYVQVPINVTNSGCQQTSLVVSPAGITIANCSAFQANWTPVVTISGTSTQVPVTWSGIGSLGTVNGGSFTLNGTTGSVTLVGTSQTGGTVQLPVTVTQCQNTGNMTVTVTPSTFSDVVGQQRTFTANVANAPNGSTPTIQWTVSPAACVNQSTGTGVTLAVTWTAACSSVTVTAQASAGGSTASGQATGTVGYGNVTCTISYNGTTSGAITINQAQSVQVTASCSNQYTPLKPYWSSADPLIAYVQGATFVETIDGKQWYSGPSAVVTGRGKGTTSITVQVDVRNPTPIATRQVTVQ